jgi:hypothetical protein
MLVLEASAERRAGAIPVSGTNLSSCDGTGIRIVFRKQVLWVRVPP